MKLACPHCAGELRVVETRSTAERIFRTRRCATCAERSVTCEMVIPDGYIPHAIRRNEQEQAA